jgi:hypothetical protein
VTLMPYVYEVAFDITPNQMSQLEIGQSLERLVGYMKVRLPSQSGFVYAAGWYSVDDPDKTRIVTRSEWSDWSDVVMHRKSYLLEDQVFEEFEPHVSKDTIAIRTYAEVGSGPFAARHD